MKIAPVFFNKPVLKTNAGNVEHCLRKNNRGDVFISFRGKEYPSGYYDDKQIAVAEKYLGKKNWEQEYFKERYREIYPPPSPVVENLYKAALIVLLLTPAVIESLVIDPAKEKRVKRIIEPEIRQIRALMFDMNNEKIQEKKEQELKIKSDLKKLEKADNERIKKEELSAKIKDALVCEFIEPISRGQDDVPTAVMLEGSNAQTRKEIEQWLESELDARIVRFKLPDDEDDAIYRLNTELQYAQEKYQKTGKRTVLFVDDFSNILNPARVSNFTIGDMKAFLFSLSENKEPMTIVFDTDNQWGIDSAFLANRRRIPLKINFDNLMLGQKKTWSAHLDDDIKNMSQSRLEIHKCWLTELADNAAKKGRYADVIRYKEINAMICEMQGKQRDAYLLRCDIDKYLKKI